MQTAAIVKIEGDASEELSGKSSSVCLLCGAPPQDKDVARLQDFQELEVVLEKAEGLSFFAGAGGLSDRPYYNMNASRLTY